MSVSGLESLLHVASPPSILELNEKQETVTREVDDGGSTQVSITSPIEERSIIRQFFDVVIKVVLAPFKLVLTVLGVIQGAWDGMLESFKIRGAIAKLQMYTGAEKDRVPNLLKHFAEATNADQNNVKRLEALGRLGGDANCLTKECNEETEAAIEQLVSGAFESLPDPLRSAVTLLFRVQTDVSYLEMRNALTSVIETCPSTVLHTLEKKMRSVQGDDESKDEVIRELNKVTVSDIEPEVTEDFIKQEVLRISQLVRDSLRQDEESLKVSESVTIGVIQGAWDGMLESFKIRGAIAKLQMYTGAEKDRVPNLLKHFAEATNADQNDVNRLEALGRLGGDANCLTKECNEETAAAIEQLVSGAFESLPDPLRSAVTLTSAI